MTRKKKAKKINWVKRLVITSIIFILIALAATAAKLYASDPYYDTHMQTNDQTRLEERLIHDGPRPSYYTPISRPGSREYQLKTRGESSIYDRLEQDPMFRE